MAVRRGLADINVRDKDGRTASDHAMNQDIKERLKTGVDSEARSKTRDTPIETDEEIILMQEMVDEFIKASPEPTAALTATATPTRERKALLETNKRASTLEGFQVEIAKGKNDSDKFREALQQAKRGDANAQFLLGTMYVKGEGHPKDYNESSQWYRMAAEQGFSLAQYSLGTLYKLGLGVLQDYVEAHKWFNLAAVQGTENALKDRDSLTEIMTPSQIQEAQRLAKEFKPKKGKSRK